MVTLWQVCRVQRPSVYLYDLRILAVEEESHRVLHRALQRLRASKAVSIHPMHGKHTCANIPVF